MAYLFIIGKHKPYVDDYTYFMYRYGLKLYRCNVVFSSLLYVTKRVHIKEDKLGCLYQLKTKHFLEIMM